MSSLRSRARSYVLDAYMCLFSCQRTLRRHIVASRNFLGESSSPPLVELNGIEPSTSGLQSPRSPS